MQCQICKAELPAEARVCPACGAPTPYNVLEPEKEQTPSPTFGSPDDTLIKHRPASSEQSIGVEDSERTLRAPYSEPTVRAPSRWQQLPPVPSSAQGEAAAQQSEAQASGSGGEHSQAGTATEATPTASPASGPAAAPASSSQPGSVTPVLPPRDVATSYGWVPPSAGSGSPSYPGQSGPFPPSPAQFQAAGAAPPTPAPGSPPQPASQVSQSGIFPPAGPGYPPAAASSPGSLGSAGPSYPGYPPSFFPPGPMSAAGPHREAGAALPQQSQPGWPWYPQQPTPGAAAPGSGPGFPPSPPAPGQAKGGRSTLLLILAIVLICVMILLGSVVYLGVIRPGQEHAAATATAESATALARSHQTATAVAQANATATVTALQNNPQAFYSYVTAQTPQVNDSLASQSASNWDDMRNNDGSGCQFNNGALHILTTANTPAWACAANAATYHNLAFQVDMTMVKGDKSGLQTMAGLVFRLDENTRSFYSFTISPSSAYLLSKVDNGNVTYLSEGVSSAINANLGESNTLTVIAQENTLILFVNQHYLATVHDSALTSGMVGLVALTTGKISADAAFQNAKIWQL
ncbi:zinc ribbon domain-containing protein [Thermogemmatispora carboxidivorans]|uniref:zinc ribbon domain-containing protein n=1 Tax=Thermogemmatispora carboxidivorans TaxID=1382306 RepID=UPI00069AD9E2|nr:zinc ribbon domain-containing protein [Thermogemmatispora carboxidivorans]